MSFLINGDIEFHSWVLCLSVPFKKITSYYAGKIQRTMMAEIDRELSLKIVHIARAINMQLEIDMTRG